MNQYRYLLPFLSLFFLFGCNGVSDSSSTNSNEEAEGSFLDRQLGSIEFVSALPESIVLKSTGGQGKQEVSQLTFLVKGKQGNPLSEQIINFSLDSSIGGIALSVSEATSNEEGLVTTTVSAGTVPTAVRVSAFSFVEENGQQVEVRTQSDLLSISTGLPTQRGFSLGATNFNIEGAQFSGEESTITARLSDSFNNPVVDGTTVNFTSEGGSIVSTCRTTNGACSVVWTSQDPRPLDHRVTVLAYAIGHESFIDSNGNNIFDDADGGAVIEPMPCKAGNNYSQCISSGLGRIDALGSPLPFGFFDMADAWRDDNESGDYDIGEPFFNITNSAYSDADSLFNGSQCQGSNCNSNTSLTYIRKAIVLVMSGSNAFWTLSDVSSDPAVVIANNQFSNLLELVDGESVSLNLTFLDSADQPLPKGTEVTVSSTTGDLSGTVTYTVGTSISASTQNIDFNISNELGGELSNGFLTIEIVTPQGIVTSGQVNIRLLAPVS